MTDKLQTHPADHPDVRDLRKWLNEGQTCAIDRPALARVLAMFSQPARAASATRTAMDVTIEDKSLELLYGMVAPSEVIADGECNPVRLLLGDGHSGFGLYIASADYPEEGAELLAPVKEPASQSAEAASAQKPVFWYRPVGTDGVYQGPIHDSSIELVRKTSGAWKPLYTAPSLELVQQLTNALASFLVVVEAHTEASHLTDGFKPKRNNDDYVLERYKTALAEGRAWLEANK